MNGFRNLGGIDYSNLANIAKQALINTDIKQIEANMLDIKTTYNCVCSFSVFHYFKSIDYAKEVISKMIAKATKKILFLDILDIDKKDLDIAYRKDMCGKDYERLYGNLPYTYYSQDLFVAMAKDNNFDILIENQNIKGYANSSFRFNVIMSKKE